MNDTTDSTSVRRLPLLRIALGAAIVFAALALALFFDASAASAAEAAQSQMGLAGLAPSLLVFGGILLFAWIPADAIRREGRDGAAYQCWGAASGAIHFWAIAMAGISVVCTLFLGSLSDSMGWTGAMEGDFPRVIINDFQEASTLNLVLLAIYYGSSCLRLRRGRKS